MSEPRETHPRSDESGLRDYKVLFHSFVLDIYKKKNGLLQLCHPRLKSSHDMITTRLLLVLGLGLAAAGAAIEALEVWWCFCVFVCVLRRGVRHMQI